MLIAGRRRSGLRCGATSAIFFLLKVYNIAQEHYEEAQPKTGGVCTYLGGLYTESSVTPDVDKVYNFWGISY